MKNEITFNISELNKKNFIFYDLKIIQGSLKKKVILNNEELLKAGMSSWSTDSGQIRQFIQDVFGINFDITLEHASNHRNRLNTIIKNVTSAESTRAKKTVLNFTDYVNLITSDDFIKFISSNLMKDFVPENQQKMYDELMFLQVNRYQKTTTYQMDNDKFFAALGSAFNLVMYVSNYVTHDTIIYTLKNLYASYVGLMDNNMNYESENINCSDEVRQLLEIISYRFNQNSNFVYSYSSYEDVMSTNDQQLLKFFIRDTFRWYYSISDGN